MNIILRFTIAFYLYTIIIFSIVFLASRLLENKKEAQKKC